MAAAKPKSQAKPEAKDATKGGERQFADTPSGWASRWRMEIDASTTYLEQWHRESETTVKRFLDRREKRNDDSVRVNIYTSNLQTQEAMLFGKTPKVDVSPRFGDFLDDGARIGATMLDRLLNTDIARGSDTYSAALEYSLSDFLRGGLGVARVMYETQFVTTELEEEEKDPASEDARVRYWHWRDVRWSPARIWHDVRWVAFGAHLSREDCIKFAGDDVGARIPMQKQGPDSSPQETDAQKADPWSRALVWEIWDKERKGVWFWAKGLNKVIVPVGVESLPNGMIPDPLELEGFFPCPRPLLANGTTDGFVPRSDYGLVQDLYNEIDELSTRISKITRACRVAGVYDAVSEAVQRLVSEATENELIAVEGWAKFADKGGLKGSIDWLPLEMIAAALDKLREMRAELKNMVDEISGFSDIVRGQQQGDTTATTSAIEAKFASVRMRRRQDEFARFASDLQRIRSEIICKHFDDQTIIQRSNVLRTPDKDQAMQGLAAIRDDLMQYRIEVRPENLALDDYAALRNERVEIIGAIAQYLQIAAPAAQQLPGAAPYLLEILQWLIAGVKGGSQVSSILQQAIAAVREMLQNPPPPQPDPKLEAVKVKAGAESTKAKLDVVGKVIDIQAHSQKTGMELERAHVEHRNAMESEEAKQRTEALKSVAAVTAPGTTPTPTV